MTGRAGSMVRTTILGHRASSTLPRAVHHLYFALSPTDRIIHSMKRPQLLLLCIASLALALSGCVQRQLTVKSNPPGALVYLNGEEFGRTPVTRDFTWYGTYDVALRKDGYRTLKTRGRVIAPWWQWVPFDLVAELFPLTDRHTLAYTLTPQSQNEASPEQMIEQAKGMKGELRGTKHTQTRVPASSTQPAK